MKPILVTMILLALSNSADALTKDECRELAGQLPRVLLLYKGFLNQIEAADWQALSDEADDGMLTSVRGLIAATDPLIRDLKIYIGHMENLAGGLAVCSSAE